MVILGGGFGGLAAARALSRAPVRLTLVDRQNHHLFQPLLYQVATATLNPSEIAAPLRALIRPPHAVLMDEVREIHPERKQVVLAHGTLDYDYLVVATGASTSFFGNDQWAHYTLGLKTVDEALEVRRRMLLAFEHAERTHDPEERRRLLTFVLVGGGTHRRGDGRVHGRDRQARAQGRLREHRSQQGADHPARGTGSRAGRLSGEALARRRRRRCWIWASRCGPAPG